MNSFKTNKYSVIICLNNKMFLHKYKHKYYLDQSLVLLNMTDENVKVCPTEVVRDKNSLHAYILNEILHFIFFSFGE